MMFVGVVLVVVVVVAVVYLLPLASASARACIHDIASPQGFAPLLGEPPTSPSPFCQ
jgi:hypothetical protein